MTPAPCPFCTFVLAGRTRPLLAETDTVVAFEDAFPSAAGHTLIIPRRHVGRISGLTNAEHAELWQVARDQIARLDTTLGSDGFSVGVNDGPAAGQTVAHVHLHVIPRNAGDVPDARGGIRWVLPDTADYWSDGVAELT